LIIKPCDDRCNRIGIIDLVLLTRDITKVRCTQDVGKCSEQIICRKGLGIEYIQSSTCDPIALKSLNEGIFVHDRAARRVYQPRGRFHLCEFSGTDQVTGRFDKNKMDGENIGLGEKLILVTSVAPASSASSFVVRSLQVITCISKA